VLLPDVTTDLSLAAKPNWVAPIVAERSKKEATNLVGIRKKGRRSRALPRQRN